MKKHNILFQKVNISRVVVSDFIRHPVYSMDGAYASEDTGSRALACPSGYQIIRVSEYQGIRVFTGMTEI
jgi:hypothetical protein